MDLVKIGFLIKADGLKDANTEVEKLLTKVDQVGKQGKQSATEFESSQKKIKESSQQVTKEVDKTSKALERQRIVGDYLGKGLDKTTATSIASFKQLGATVSQTNEYISNELNNKGLEQTRKDLEKLAKQQEKQAEAVKKTVSSYEALSSKTLGGGVLDQVEKQNKSLLDMRKHYESIESSQEKQNKSVAQTVSTYEKLSNKSIGSGLS